MPLLALGFAMMASSALALQPVFPKAGVYECTDQFGQVEQVLLSSSIDFNPSYCVDSLYLEQGDIALDRDPLRCKGDGTCVGTTSNDDWGVHTMTVTGKDSDTFSYRDKFTPLTGIPPEPETSSTCHRISACNVVGE